MSMPERIWRIVRGRWLMAEEQIRGSLAEDQAEEELSQALAGRPASTPLPSHGAGPWSPAHTPAVSRPYASLQDPKAEDPLAADLALLGAPPACSMEILDRLYAARLAELRPEAHPAGSPERARVDALRTALSVAYERLRDAINTTETRFEKLEF